MPGKNSPMNRSNPLRFLSSVFQVIIYRFGAFGGIALLILGILLTVDVLSRAIRGHPITGVSELAQLMLVMIIFFTISYTQSIQGHVKMEAVISRMGKKMRGVCDLISLTICLSISILLLYGCAWEAYDSIILKEYHFGTTRFPLWPAKLSVVFGIFLLIIQFVKDIFSNIRSIINPNKNDSI